MFNWKNQPTKRKLLIKISKTSIYDWVPKTWFSTRNGAVQRMKISIWGQPVFLRDCCYLSLYVATSFYLSDDGVSHIVDTQEYLLHKSGQLSYFPFSPIGEIWEVHNMRGEESKSNWPLWHGLALALMWGGWSLVQHTRSLFLCSWCCQHCVPVSTATLQSTQQSIKINAMGLQYKTLVILYTLERRLRNISVTKKKGVSHVDIRGKTYQV